MEHIKEWFYGKLDEDERIITVGPVETDIHYEDAICHVLDGNHDALENAKLICAIPHLQQVRLALEDLVKQFGKFEESENKNQADAYYNLVKYAQTKWETAKQALIDLERKLNDT
jgi:hypothetical protein